MADTLKFVSYNSGGFAQDKRTFIECLLADTDILFIQEHWLNHGNLGELDKVAINHVPHGESGMPVGILRGPGRPYGGVAIYYSKEIAHDIVHQKSPDTKNIVHIKLGNNCHIINVYLPGDNYRQSYIDPEFQEAMDTLDELGICS